MEPITAIALAAEVAKKTGLSDWIGKKISGNKSAKAVVDIAKKVADVAKVDSWTPEQIEAVRTQLMQFDLEIEKLAAGDRDSARKMQIAALAQDDVFSKRFIYYLASFWSLFAVSYIFSITFFEMPESSIRFADTCLGFVLGTVITTIITFFYGSSMGSKIKGRQLSKSGQSEEI